MAARSPELPASRDTSPVERLALVAIVAGGCALRVWGVRYGLPHPIARPDEEVLIAKVVGFETGDLNPHWFMYPTFFLYLLYGWVKSLVLAAHAIGMLPVLVTGGAGFVGRAVVARLRAAGCTRITVPRRRDYDLTRGERVQALFREARPDLVIHLAARVGGIGANQRLPGTFF